MRLHILTRAFAHVESKLSKIQAGHGLKEGDSCKEDSIRLGLSWPLVRISHKMV
jgi:hypothetical protein